MHPPNARVLSRVAILGWLALCFIALLTIQGFRRSHLLDQSLWTDDGLTRLEWAAGVYLIWSAAFLIFARRWFVAATVAALLILVGAAAGPAAPAGAAFFLFSCFVTGTLLMPAEEGGGPLSGLMRLMLGAAVWMNLFWVALHFRINYPLVYASLLLAPLLAKPGVARACMAVCARAFRPLVLPRRTDYVFLALAGFPALCQLIVAMAPETGSDALATHLMIPQWVAFQHVWPFDFRHISWAAMPLGADWCYAAAYLLGGEFAAHLLNFAFFAAVCAMVYAGCRRHLGQGSSFLLAGLFASTPLAQLVTGSLFVENFWAALLVAAVCAIARFHSTEEPRFLYLAAALTGAGLGTKLGTTAFLIPAAAFAAYELARAKAFAGRRVRIGFGAAGALLLFGGAPYAYAWAFAGNPIFPYMNQIFKSPWFDSMEPFVDNRWAGRPDWLLPYRLAFRTHAYIEGHDGALGFQYLFFAAFGLAACSRKWPFLGKLAFATAAVFSAVTFSSVQYLRYLYPAMPLFTIGGAAALARMRADSRALYAAAVAVLAAALPLNVYFLSSSGWFHADFLVNPFDPKEVRAKLVAEAPERLIIGYLNERRPGMPTAFFQTDSTAGLRAASYVYGWHMYPYLMTAMMSQTPAAYAHVARDLNIRYFVAPVGWDQSNDSPAIRAFVTGYTEPEFQAGNFELRTLKPGADAQLLRDDVQPPLPPCPAGLVDDRSPLVHYTGHWRVMQDFGDACGGTLTYSEAPDAQASFAFTGPSVTYVFTKAYVRGIAEVSIDGVKRDPIDQYYRGIEWRAEVTYSGLSAGPHTIAIRPLHQRSADARAWDIDIDGFAVGGR
jgi:hypothetical protein